MFANVLLAPAAPQQGGAGPLSLGLRLDGGAVYWGDVILPAGPERAAAVLAIYALRERIAAALGGQSPDGLGDLSQRVRAASGDESAAGEALAGAAQWAYLAALQAQPDAAGQLRREYGLPDDGAIPAVYAEISDYAATAERIDRLLALRPAAIGYRLTATGDLVAAAIGERAEHLQRFVRELGRRADMLAPGEGYAPAVYLGLNGALGQLAGDPARHIGKVLGHVVGLQDAAGERQLFLEEPFRLDETLVQVANLHRLRDFIRRTPSSLQRAKPTQVVAPCPLTADEAQVYADTGAVHGLVADASGDPHWLLTGLARARSAGLDAYWRLPARSTPRQIVLAVFLARVTSSPAILVSGDDSDVGPALVTRLLAEAATER